MTILSLKPLGNGVHGTVLVSIDATFPRGSQILHRTNTGHGLPVVLSVGSRPGAMDGNGW